VTLSPAGNFFGALYHKLYTQSSAPEDVRNYRPKHVELIEITNKLLLFHLVSCLYYCIRDARSHKRQTQFLLLYSCIWVIPRRLNFMCRRFGTLCQFHLHRCTTTTCSYQIRGVESFLRSCCFLSWPGKPRTLWNRIFIATFTTVRHLSLP